MKKTKVVLIGAGSTNFGRGSIIDLLSSEELKQTHLTISLVDIDEVGLDRMFRFAQILKEYNHSDSKIEATTDHHKALEGADYVIAAVARKRYELWDRDFLVPYSYGFKQITAECGGPGAAFHTLRSLHLTIPIAKDMERICPDALFISYSNPVSRVCMGLKMLTNIRFVGLCHGAFGTLQEVARILGKHEEEIDITAGGLNHFHWVLKIRDKKTGDDLYPKFDLGMKKAESQLDLQVPPLTKMMYETFGIMPFPSDNHIGEYVQFSYEITGPYFHHPVSTTWGKRMLGVHCESEREKASNPIQRLIDGIEPMTDKFIQARHELAVSIICDMEFDRNRQEISVNIPNDEFAISNLPEDSIVEIPAVVDAKGLHPVKVGPLPEAVAAMCRTQISIQKLLVDAYAQRSKRPLLQALALDPAVDSIPKAKKLIDRMLQIQGEFLPELKD